MGNNNLLSDLPENFREEKKQLLEEGFNTWLSVKKLKDSEITELAQKGRSTTHNLNRLRGIATLICDINLSQADAALLIHAGIASAKALAALNPQELIQATGRLERQLNTHRNPVVDLSKANSLIQRAKNRQLLN